MNLSPLVCLFIYNNKKKAFALQCYCIVLHEEILTIIIFNFYEKYQKVFTNDKYIPLHISVCIMTIFREFNDISETMGISSSDTLKIIRICTKEVLKTFFYELMFKAFEYECQLRELRKISDRNIVSRFCHSHIHVCYVFKSFYALRKYYQHY